MSNKYRCGFLVSQIKQVSNRVLDRILQKSGIDAFNGAQGRILDVLWQKDGISIHEISQKTGLSAATLTGMLDRMEASSLISRTPAPNDRRKQLIVLNGEAKKLQADYEQVCDTMDGIWYEGFSEEEIAQLESYLTRILQNLEKGNE